MPAMKPAWSAAAAALLFASAALAARLAPEGTPAALLGAARLLLGGAALAAVLGARGPAAWSPLPCGALAIAALAMAIFQWSFFAAVALAGAGVATLASAAASPVVADALAAVRARRRPKSSEIIGAALTLLGLGCLAGDAAQSGAGLALALASGAAYAVYAAQAARFERQRAGSGLAATALSLLCAGGVLLPGALLHATPALPLLSVRAIAVVAYLGLAATALAYALFVPALRRLSAASGLAILLVQPLAAVLAAAVLFDEPVGAAHFAAAAGVALALAVRALDFPSIRHQRSKPCLRIPAAP